MENTVIIRVEIHAARKRRALQLAEVVTHRRRVTRQCDRADHIARRIVHRRPTRGARGVFPIEETGRLGLGDGVTAGPQRDERIRTARVGRRAEADCRATVVGAGERDRRAADAGFARAELDAVIVRVDEDGARERRRREFAEVITRARGAGAKSDRGNGVAVGRVVDGAAGLRTNRLPAIQQTRGLRLGQRISAGPQRGKGVVAARVGGRARAHRIAEVVRASKCDGHASHARFTRTELHAVVVHVAIDYAAQRVCRQLAEVIARRRRIWRERDRADDIARRVVHRRAACGTSGVLAVEETHRLGLSHDVAAGAEIGEGVSSAGIARRRDIDRRAEIVRAGERDRCPADARFARTQLDAVVVHVVVNGARDRGRREVGEVIRHARLPAAEDDAGNGVTNRRVIYRARRGGAGACGFPSVEQTRWLDFRECVGAGAQAGESVGTACIGGGGGAHGVAEIVGAGERDGDATDGQVAGLLHAVVVKIVEDHARQGAGRQFAEVIARRRRVRGERDRANDIARRVVHRRPARRARGVLTVEETSRLCLGHSVGAGPEIREGVSAARVARRCDIHRRAAIIGASQCNGRAVNPSLARPRLDAVVIHVNVDRARERGRRQLAKVVTRASHIRGERDRGNGLAGDGVVDRAAGLRTDGLFAVQ